MGRKRLKQKSLKKVIAAVMTAVMILASSVPALAGGSKAELPGLPDDFVTRRLTDLCGMGTGSASDAGQNDAGKSKQINDEVLEEDLNQDIMLASASSASIIYTLDGKEKESISFYVKRNPQTNETIAPDPVLLRVTQTEGTEAFGEIHVGVGIPENPEDGLQDRVAIEALNGTYLEPGKPLDFRIEFVISEDMEAGKENIINDGKKHFITVSGVEYEEQIPVFYGIDGLYSYYSAEAVTQYEGAVFRDQKSGIDYRVVGHVKLNEKDPTAFTIRHKFVVFDDMTGMDAQGNPVPLRISKVRLNPDGNFTFSDGSYEIVPRMGEDRFISIPMNVKKEVFSKWRTDAVRQNKMKLAYIVMEDLVIEYNDGYSVGGNMNPLPLVYAVSYIPGSNTGGGSGGGGGSSSGGGGGGGSGSGTTSTGTVQGPAATPRETKATSDDVGWVQKDGAWYYMDAANTPVTDWLLGPDGRWYFLAPDGVMKTGWMQIGKDWYFLNADGAMANGWVQGADGKWYYLQPDGKMAVDMRTPDGYYVGPDGVWIQ